MSVAAFDFFVLCECVGVHFFLCIAACEYGYFCARAFGGVCDIMLCVSVFERDFCLITCGFS